MEPDLSMQNLLTGEDLKTYSKLMRESVKAIIDVFDVRFQEMFCRVKPDTKPDTTRALTYLSFKSMAFVEEVMPTIKMILAGAIFGALINDESAKRFMEQVDGVEKLSKEERLAQIKKLQENMRKHEALSRNMEN